MIGLPAPGSAVVEVVPVVSVLLELVAVVAALEVELVVVCEDAVLLGDVVREVPQATQTSAVRTTAARRAVGVAEPSRGIWAGEPILEPRGPPRLRMGRFLQVVVERRQRLRGGKRRAREPGG